MNQVGTRQQSSIIIFIPRTEMSSTIHSGFIDSLSYLLLSMNSL